MPPQAQQALQALADVAIPELDMAALDLELAVASQRGRPKSALSDHLSFGLHLQEAKALVDQVKAVTYQWQQHFAQAGVNVADIESLSQTLGSSQSL
jgi:hypothetical protein